MKYCEGKTMCFRKPSVIAYAAVVGKAENEGPYGGEFDEVVEDNKAGSDTWEQAESLFQQRAVGHVLRKSGLEPDRIDLMIAGDLLNQCVGSSFLRFWRTLSMNLSEYPAARAMLARCRLSVDCFARSATYSAR